MDIRSDDDRPSVVRRAPRGAPPGLLGPCEQIDLLPSPIGLPVCCFYGRLDFLSALAAKTLDGGRLKSDASGALPERDEGCAENLFRHVDRFRARFLSHTPLNDGRGPSEQIDESDPRHSAGCLCFAAPPGRCST